MPYPMNILIIEDEEATARKLQRLLVQVAPTTILAGQLGSVEESVAWLRTNPMPELILMDIELADGQSFEIFNQVAVTCPVIFTTAYDEYALKAFKVNSIDYLLKPVREADLRAALAKLQALKQSLAGPDSGWQDSLIGLLRQLNPERAGESGSATAKPGAPATEARAERTRFLVKQGQRMFSISIEQITYFYTRSKITFLKASDGQDWMIDYTMDELENMLNPQRFFRLNRQIIAELRSVEKVHLYFNGKLKVSLTPAFPEEVLVSREKAGDFKRWLGE